MKLRTVGVLTCLALAMSLALTGSAAAEKVVLTWAHGWTGAEYANRIPHFDAWEAGFEALHPNVDVQRIDAAGDYYDTMKTRLLGGTPIDVMWIGGGIWNGYIDLLRPLNDYAKREPALLADVHPAATYAVTFDGKMYAMPFGLMTNTMFYNKALFNQAGLKYPSKDWTWDEAMDKAKKMSKDVDGDGLNDVWGMGFYWPEYMFSYGGDTYSADGRKIIMNTPQTIAVSQFFADLAGGRTEVQPPSVSSKWTTLMHAGNLAIGNRGPYEIPNMVAADLDWDVADMPIFQFNGTDYRTTWLTPEAWAIPNTSQQHELAWEFVSYLMQKEQTRRFASDAIVIPSQRSVAMEYFVKVEQPQNIIAFFNAMDYTTGWYSNHPAIGRLNSSEAFSSDTYKGLIQGTIPAQVAIPEISRLAQNVLDDWWANHDK